MSGETGASRKRYLFERVGVFAVLAAVLTIVSAVIILMPYGDTYLIESGAPRAYLDGFIAIAVLATAILILGMFYNAMIWMEGELTGVEKDLPRSKKLTISAHRLLGAVFSRDFGRHLKIFIYDSLLLRKLWRTSKARAIFHACIYWGFLGIFVLDLLTTLAIDVLRSDSFISPTGWGTLWIRGVGFELFGGALLIGLLAASLRRFVARPKQLKTGSEDVASLLFLLLVVLSGFIVEGVAISSGLHENSPSAYSFIGNAIASILPSLSVQSYAQIWFIHAAISLAFVAYIPFSKLFHIFAAPLAAHIEGIVKKEVAS